MGYELRSSRADRSRRLRGPSTPKTQAAECAACRLPPSNLSWCPLRRCLRNVGASKWRTQDSSIALPQRGIRLSVYPNRHLFPCSSCTARIEPPPLFKARGNIVYGIRASKIVHSPPEALHVARTHCTRNARFKARLILDTSDIPPHHRELLPANRAFKARVPPVRHLHRSPRPQKALLATNYLDRLSPLPWSELERICIRFSSKLHYLLVEYELRSSRGACSML